MGLDIYPLMGPLARTGWSSGGGVQGTNLCCILNSVREGTSGRGLPQLL